jgi:nucleotide-binding universal stress UspA family protein
MRPSQHRADPPEWSTVPVDRVLLATEGRPIPQSAIRFAARWHAPVRVFSIARVYGISFALPNPWLMPSKKEWQEQRDIVDQAIAALRKRGVEADGHVVGTRKATRAILREAAREGSDVIVMAANPERNRFVADLMWSQEPYRVRRRADIPVYLVTED